MNLSDLQLKEIIDISSGKRLGSIIDVVVDNRGYISKIMLDKRRSKGKIFSANKEEVYIEWSNILKLGDDIILVDVMRKKEG